MPLLLGMEPLAKSSMVLVDLPNDVLVKVLKRVDKASLPSLCKVCRHLNEIVNNYMLWKPFCPACTLCPTDLQRNSHYYRLLSWRDIYRTSKHWEFKHHKESMLIRFATNMMLPWLQINPRWSKKSSLLVAGGSTICSYPLDPNTDTARRKSRCSPASWLYQGHTNDVVRFVAKEDRLFSCSMDTTVRAWSHGCGSVTCDAVLQGHTEGVYCVDGCSGHVVSGSRDHTVKVWRIGSWQCASTLAIDDHVWSIAIDPCQSSFIFVGTAARLSRVSALQMYDVTSGKLVTSFANPPSDPQRLGAGILQTRTLDHALVMTCGYDATVRIWDARLGQCVKTWEDPHDNAMYCVETNGNMAFLTGACRFGMVRLWDRRASSCVQTYFTGRGKGARNAGSSPVYSLQMTPTHLYVGLSHGVVILNFT